MQTNLTAHEPTSPLPCLCRACLPKAPERAETQGLTFFRIEVPFERRTLHAWVPDELANEVDELKTSMQRRLARRFTRRRAPLPPILVPPRREPRKSRPPGPAKSGLWQRVLRLFGA